MPPKSPITGHVDVELTLTQPVVPGLVGHDREVPREQPLAGTAASVLADDF
jgi:hypothetical protein